MAIYYVSPTGSDSNAGTLNAPWHSLNYAFNQLTAGDQLYMRGGAYTTLYSSLIGVRISGINGTYNAPIEVTNYQNEVPVLDGSALSGGGEMFGIQMVNCDYWYIKGLKIQNVRGANFSRGFEFQDGCSNCTLERVDITLCGGGFTFGGSIPFYNILYKNCDAWDNWDVVDSGGYCNGFNGNLPAGSTVTCYGCRSWHNSDDGYDNMAGGGYITYINCWAFWNGHTSIGGSTSGDGDGFKLGYTTKGDEAGNQRTLYNCLSFENDLMGFDESMDAATSQDMALYNCVSYGNASYGFRFSAANIGGAGTGVTTLRNNIAYNDSGTEYEGRARNVEDHNSWDGGVTVSDADFVSVSSVGADGARQTDGSLPVLNFLHLVAGSDLKNAGSATGVYNTDGAGYAWGTPPSMGAYEVGSTPPPNTVLVSSITLSAPSAVITTQNGTLQITATVLPVNATNQAVQWIVIAGTGTGSVSNTGLLTALTDGTVTVRANATDGSGIFGTFVVTISNQSTITPPLPTSGLRDRDGNEYTSVVIGTQEWICQNLKVTHYADGTPIVNITDSGLWTSDTDGAYCWYNNDIANKSIYGALYNWLAVNNGLAYLERNGVEETGWHFPSSAELATLSATLGGDLVSGGKLKESGLAHWQDPNVGADNSSGFTALPAGVRHDGDGSFDQIYITLGIWAGDAYDATSAYNFFITNNSSVLGIEYNPKTNGYSARLVRDYSSVPPDPPDPPVPPTFPDVIPYHYGNAPTFRFFISSVSSVSYEVFPLKFLSSSLVTELQKDKILYRQKFSGSLIFGSNSKVLDSLGVEHNRRDDWDLFWMIELSDPDGKYYLTIYKDFGGATETYFEGYFSTSDGEFDIDNCTFEVTPIAIDDYNEIFENADTKQNILSVPAMGTVHAIHGGMDVNYTRTRWLAKLGSDNVLEYIAQRTFGLDVIVLSDFFTVDPNYVTLTDNLLLNLTIAQKSDIIRYNSSDPATYAPLTWNELMEILWNMFQVTWKYDIFTDTVRVEHISYFTRSAGIDLRTQLLCNATNKYKYLKEKMPKFEKFSFMEADETNFVGAFIYYDSGAVNQDSESNRVDTTIQVTTDLEYIYYNPDAISDEGFVILCNYLDGADYKVRLDSGKLATTVKLNMNLSVANLQDAYFRHNRVLIEGYLNGVLTDFWTAQKTKIQTCSAILCDPIDPLDEITTELGETYLGGAKAVIKDLTVDPMGLAKFNLLYGPPDNTNTGIPNIFSVEVTLVVRSPYDPAFDEIDLLYVFNQPCVGNITTRFRVATFNDTGVFQGYSGWTNAILLDTTLSLSVLNHQISVLSAGWSISIELEYTTGEIDVLAGVPDATWSYSTPFIYTAI